MPWTAKSQHTSSVSFYCSSFLENTQPFLPGCFDRLSPLPGMLACYRAISLSISTHDQNLKLLSTPNLASPERSPGYSFYNMIFNF